MRSARGDRGRRRQVGWPGRSRPALGGGGRGLRYRVLDAWGWIRPRFQRSLYGDQGMFVRRDVFERLGGFADLPACEDLEFSERLCRAGRVVLLPGPLRTSARRWQQRGGRRTVMEIG